MSATIIFGYAFPASAYAPPDGALWNSDQSAAVIAIPGATGTRVIAYLRRQDGTFLEVDVSAAEGGNLGKLGQRPMEYDRFETKPIAWLPRQDGRLQVIIQTRAWRAGHRVTVSEPLLIRTDGSAIWR